MDIEINLPRGQFSSFSINSSREIFVNSAASLIKYTECLQAQSGNLM